MTLRLNVCSGLLHHEAVGGGFIGTGDPRGRMALCVLVCLSMARKPGPTWRAGSPILGFQGLS